MDFEKNSLPEGEEPTPAPNEPSSLPEAPIPTPEAPTAAPEGNAADPATFSFGTPPTRMPGGIPKRNNAFAIASLICAILSIPCCCCYFGIAFGVAAIVCAIFDRVRNGKFSGMALAGLIVGIIGVCLAIGMMILSALADSLLESMIAEGLIDPEVVRQLVEQGAIDPEAVPPGILEPETTTTTFRFFTGGNA